MGKDFGAKELFGFLGNLSAVWALAILVGIVTAWRSPQLLREILTGIREHKRVTAEIRRKQEKVDRDIAAKRAKLTAIKDKLTANKDRKPGNG